VSLLFDDIDARTTVPTTSNENDLRFIHRRTLLGMFTKRA
jgi:hypothetical protein